ncbi:MAG: hypothetical protein IKS31_09275 [Clostridia bacterium]|nr:hypothetical protein [Clostridia bacterium]MBR4459135.1 hypothetical protein [Clostridia bacterium]
MDILDRGSAQRKTYVKVRADFMPDGRLVPLMFRTEDGPTCVIDRIIDVRPAPSLKSGGQGMRYTVHVKGRQYYLFNDRGRWFAEE